MAANGGAGILFQYTCTGTVKNCIVWQNPIESDENVPEGQVRVTHSIVAGADVFPGEGNSNADPLFAGAGDFHLQEGSPAIDAGTSDGAPTTDIEGYARPCGAGVDLGAHEAGGCLPEARNNLEIPPDPLVKDGAAVAYAATLEFPGGEESWTLDGATFRNVGLGDAALLLESSRLYVDDGDGLLTDQDAPLGSAALFDSATQTLVFSGLEHSGAPGSRVTYFLLCELAGAPPVARATGADLPSSSERGLAAPLLAASVPCLLLLVLMGRRRLRFLFPALALLACAGFIPSSGCGDGGGGSGDRTPPASRQIQMELMSLDVRGSPGLAVRVDGLPSRAWTFDG